MAVAGKFQFNVKAELKGGTPSLIKLKKAKKLLSDFRPTWNIVLKYIWNSYKRSFSRGSRGGITWAPNSDATVIIKGSSKPLVDTGRLRKALTGPSPDSFIRKTKYTLTIGLRKSMEYASAQEEGFSITVTESMRRFMAGKYGIILGSIIEVPARPFMSITSANRRRINIEIKNIINKEVKKFA